MLSRREARRARAHTLMMRTTALWALALAALAGAGALHAHHSGYVYETTPVWIAGTVVRFEHTNPHTVMTLESAGDDGEPRHWAIEGPGQAQLDRMGFGRNVPQVGDTVEICAFPVKSAEELARIFPETNVYARRATPDADGLVRQFAAGHIILMPDGERRFWEPHGLISECMRSSNEDRQVWLDFLGSNTRAREGWCQQSRYAHVRSTAALQELVAEINALIRNPCE